MSKIGFEAVIKWMRQERIVYQTKKFDYVKEADRRHEASYWLQQFGSYEQRLEALGLNSPLGKQAALKLAATAIALCEHLADEGPLPEPGYSSGTIVQA